MIFRLWSSIDHRNAKPYPGATSDWWTLCLACNALAGPYARESAAQDADDEHACTTQLGWTLQCRECGRLATGKTVMLAYLVAGMRFHYPAWPDGTNPRLCTDCRQKRGCGCWSCGEERKVRR